VTAPAKADPALAKTPAAAEQRRRDLLLGAVLVALVLLTFSSGFRGAYIWDDTLYLTHSHAVQRWDGLTQIWLNPRATADYYPVTYSLLWLEHKCFGVDRPDGWDRVGYHFISALLHAGGALLLWRLLRRLKVPGAYLAAALWAMHPLQVESVAWIAETKNTLSGVLAFAAAWAYVRFSNGAEAGEPDRPRWGFYALASVLFGAAMLAKGVTVVVPAALLVVLWWHQRLRWRLVLPLMPWFAVAAGMAVVWSRQQQGMGASAAENPDLAFTLSQRWAIAGHALWFYLGKFVYPQSLALTFPRWDVSHLSWLDDAYLPAFGAAALVLWLLRRRLGRGPLVALVLYAVIISPASGIVTFYTMLYSFVASHYAYLALAPLCALVGAGVAWLSGLLARSALSAQRPGAPLPLGAIAGGLLVASCAALSWGQAALYVNPIALWTDTVERSPDSWVAHLNLGYGYLEAKDYARAADADARAAQLHPNDHRPWEQLGAALLHLGQLDAAAAAYRREWEVMLPRVRANAIRVMRAMAAASPEPPAYDPHYCVAVGYDEANVPDQAVAWYRQSEAILGPEFHVEYRLGVNLERLGKTAEALTHLERAARMRPAVVGIWGDVALLRAKLGDAAGAAAARNRDAAARRGARPATTPAP
jgi:tetratricopeptide (TPR) repeat protein